MTELQTWQRSSFTMKGSRFLLSSLFPIPASGFGARMLVVWLFLFFLSSFGCYNNAVHSYQLMPTSTPLTMSTRRFGMTMKRGKGSSFREIEGDSSSSSSFSGNNQQRSWYPVAGVRSLSELLPQQQPQGSFFNNNNNKNTSPKIKVVDTMLDVLINPQTNPTGAVCVTRIQNQIYCFDAACPSCRIPLVNAQILPASQSSNTKAAAPRLSCSFCRATFDLSTGQRLETSQEGGGMFFSGIVKNVFAAKSSGPLPIYALGESKDGGQVVISL